jgi:accessory colonization factor AcfC
MKNLNTFPIEDFLDKARIAIKTNQKNITLTIKEVTDLQNSLSVVMTRIAGESQSTGVTEDIVVKITGGEF